jgi:hypothetical protein
MPKKFPTKFVPCDGCVLCCQGDAIRLEREDIARGYLSEPHPYVPGALMLAHKANGDCVYLGDSGCTIHGRAPALCRAADCRSVALRYDLEGAKALHMTGRLNFDVWDKGNRLLMDMTAEVREEMRKRGERDAARAAARSARGESR